MRIHHGVPRTKPEMGLIWLDYRGLQQDGSRILDKEKEKKVRDRREEGERKGGVRKERRTKGGKRPRKYTSKGPSKVILCRQVGPKRKYMMLSSGS